MARVDTQQTNFRLINYFMAKNGDVMTRQVKRQLERLRDKAQRGKPNRRNELLARQAERERNGFYDGQTSVATALAHNRAGRMQRQLNNDGALVRLR